MTDTLRGTAVFAQSGGPTAVVNASLSGAIQEAGKADCIDKLLGAYNGILGVLQEELFDLRKERAEDIENLKKTPGGALGSCCYQPKSGTDFERIAEVLKAHNVRFFFCAGGRDSMAAANQVAEMAAAQGYELRVVGIPKAIDNNLVGTDHCPGYGSAVKFAAAQAMEAGRDTEALWTHWPCAVQEVMGRSSGWIAAGTGLARRAPEDAPHLIYVPERPVTLDRIAKDVGECLQLHRRCSIVASEGLKDQKGAYLAESGGVAELLRAFVEKELGVKCRSSRAGTAQRAAMHFASLTDVNEAVEVGVAAVRKAVRGQSGVMVTLVREPGPVYRASTGTVRLADAAGGERLLPGEYLNADGNGITEAMKDYVRPLLRGEAPVNMGPDGLPVYVRLQRRFVPRKLVEWKPAAAGK